MKTLDILLNLFWLIDEKLKDVKKHSQSQLYRGETILIGVLYALKG